MKPQAPSRIFIPATWPRLSTALLLALGTSSQAGDLLRGGGSGPTAPVRSAGGNEAGGVQAAQARANAADALARTTQAITAVQQMQAQARALALTQNNAGTGLPNVPNGLAAGGLQIAPGAATNPALWTGANQPAQSTRTTTTNGTTTTTEVVTVKQTSQQALLNWETFNVGRGTELYFDQTAGGASRNQWIAFNKVNDPSGVPSQILGSIKAEGQVYVINRNGIIFGGASEVNTHTLVASSLPLNDNLVSRGLLNNPDAQFLFSSLPQSAGLNGTPAVTPAPGHEPNGRIGDVTVQAGARILAPTSADKIGGRVALIGPNVTNAGTIQTPDGQTILAAGLQVGMVAHDTNDPTLRGLDIYVGAVTDPASVIPSYAGTATNSGLISALRANVTMTGKDVKNTGAIESSTSVSLNGRIDLSASYDAVSTGGLKNVAPFLYRGSGTVTLGEGSTARILPERESTEKVVGTRLALNSKVNITGRAVHFAQNSSLLAPNADVNVDAGVWNFIPSSNAPETRFVHSAGQIYLSENALLNVAGSTDVLVPVSQNFVRAELRAAELADSPLLRNSPLRGQSVIVDIRNTGVYNGKPWVGSPIADVSGYANLIERTAGELTVGGGTVNLNAGGSVVMQPGAAVDVSDGWIQYTGTSVQTTRLLTGGRVIDIAAATPDRVYEGIYTGNGTSEYDQWSLTESYISALGVTGRRTEPGLLFGAAGGTLSITAPGMALDGSLRGLSVVGPRQRSQQPRASELTLSFQREETTAPYYAESPTPPIVTFRSGTLPAANPFALDASGLPLPLLAERNAQVLLSPGIFSSSGFGALRVNNGDGDIIVPEGVTLAAPVLGTIALTGANVTIGGNLSAPGGSIALTASTVSPYLAAKVNASPVQNQKPGANADRGNLTISAHSTLSAAGLQVDDRLYAEAPVTDPLIVNGGNISLNGYRTVLPAGSVLDVSGGAAVSPGGRVSYGTGGTLNLRGGQDPNVASVTGGSLSLHSTLIGYSGGRGATLSITAPAVQIGGSTTNAETLLLQPDFFSTGGFTGFAITGTGLTTSTAGQFTPGVFIAPGTQITPVAQSWLAETLTPETALVLRPVLQQEGVRSPVNLSFSASGVINPFGSAQAVQQVRGDLVMGSGAVIRTDARAAVSFSGDTVDLPGQVYAPGGSISVSAARRSQDAFFQVADGTPLTTLHLGGQSVLSTAGRTVFTPHVRGYRNGTVLAGGTVTLSGNIAAEAGSLIDVSGATDELDVAPGAVLDSRLDHTSLGGAEVVRTRVDSAGGTINLTGGQQLYVDSTLRGQGGGPGAAGGILNISSTRFYNVNGGIAPNVVSASLLVRQSGNSLPAGAGAVGAPVTNSSGEVLTGMGYFAADQFNGSGLGALTLSGSVQFSGPVSLTAQRSLSVATSGILMADDSVTLNAPQVSLGQRFVAPKLLAEQQSYTPFTDAQNQVFHFPPLPGTGTLTVNANLIDAGNLSFQGLSSVNLLAPSGDIRGNGSMHLAGSLLMRAGQVYPTTAGTFNITAYNNGAQPGSVTIESGANRQLPYSAGGVLNIFAPVIHQNGTLRAPMGTINLGWDGSGTAPKDPITNQAVPVTTNLTLGQGSLTSVSSINPLTGAPVMLPYGLNAGGTAWIDPSGTDITRVGPPSKNVNLAGQNVDVQSGSTIDVRGGGDLYAYRWVQGNGGTRDVLNSTTSFAIIPGYAADYAPYAPFNPSTQATGLSGDPGYVNNTLLPGDQIYLNASSGLPAGVYTLLPAHYALLPGAFLVSPKSGTPGDTVLNPDKSSMVSGYRFNSANAGGANTLLTTWEVASSAVVRTRSQFEDYRASTFFAQPGAENTVPRLPTDAGRLLLTAAQQLAFGGTLTASTPAGARGALVDISSPVDIFIAGPGTTGTTGVLTLNAADLSSFNAQSLLIGGVRQTGATGTTVSVKTNKVTVDNAGTPLSGGDIILVSNGEITLEENAEITQPGTGKAETLNFGNGAAGSGNGALLRLSGDTTAQVVRKAITNAAGPSLNIGAGVRLTGTSLTLDSTAATTLDATARLLSQAINVSSGRISLALDNPGTLQPDAGLVLTGAALNDLQNAANLSFLSYSSLDIYGTGQVGRTTTQNLALHAAQIRGFNNGGGKAILSAQNVLLDNAAAGLVPGTVAAPSGTLAIEAGVIRTGLNQVQVDQFHRLELNATGGVVMQGSGGLSTSGSALLTTPLLTGTAGAVQSLRAAGALEITGSGTATVAGGFGARLNLEGGSVRNTTNILLPSGEITLHSTSGDIVAGGRLDTAGTARQFYDQTKYTDGGSVTLTADTGSVSIPSGGVVSVAAPAAGGNAGSLTINAPAGTVNIPGTLAGAGGAGGRSGSASITSGSLAALAALDALLNASHFMESRTYRALAGDVAVDGTGRAHSYSVSADRGSINVTGTIDAAGTTGGNISLQANGNVTLAPTARLTTAAAKHDAAGKGGSVYLSAGTQRDGVVSSNAVLDLQSGSAINLSVAAPAVAGQASGTLHLRAPQNAAGTDVQMNAIGSTITNASAITVEGYRVFDLTGSGGTIDAAVQTNVKDNGTAFGGATAAMMARLLNGGPLQNITAVIPGAELLNRTGDLTLTTTWDLSTFRFGPDNATPGVLTLRAAGNLNFNFATSLSDGFGGGSNGAPLWQQPLMAAGSRSWAYHLSAGADLSAADYRAVQSLAGLAANKGSLVIGSNAPASMTLPTTFTNTLRDSIITPRYQTIRTGTGDIIINAGRDVQILNPLGNIYTAGTQATAMANFDLPDTSYSTASTLLGVQQLPFPVPSPQYSYGGGNVSVFAQQDIARYRVVGTGANATLVPDSTREMPTNWLYRRSFVDPATGQFTSTRAGRDVASTSWWVDFTNFFEGVGALGGGNVSMIAGRDVANVDALIPTNARMPKGTPNAGALLELGGGDLIVRSGRDIDGGVYYVERGTGTLAAGGSIKTNSTRAALLQSDIATLTVQGLTPDPASWLPTTLFAGKSTFDVSARGDVLLGPVANPFLLPQGINNSYHLKTWFSTYSESAGVNVSSLGGNVTLKSDPNGDEAPTLQAWYQKVLRFGTSGTFGRSQPWLRLVETDATPFGTASALMPGTLRATAFSGDINLTGNLTLSPSATGTIDFLAAGAINGLQPNAWSPGFGAYTWSGSRINLSDTDPTRLPGIAAPLNMNGPSTPNAWGNTLLTIMDGLDARFNESGSTTGAFAVLQTKQALHAPGLLHAADTQPLRLYAGSGSISGLTLFAGKAGRVFAGADIADVSLYLQNVRATDISVVAASRDIIAYAPNSALRTQAQLAGNILDPGTGVIPMAGDLQISGPGTLQVLAGRNFDLGTGPINSDRTALGLTSIGNARNPSLPFEGAKLVAGAGLGAGGGTENPNLDYAAFITKYVTAPTVIGEDTHHYLAEILGGKSFEDFKKLTTEEQEALVDETRARFDAMSESDRKLLALGVFYRVLRDTGRARARTGGYTAGEEAIATLFKGNAWQGDIALTSRQIKTQSGGDIQLFAPGGKLTVGLDSATAQGADQGILTESGGTISIFTHNSVVVGTSRIFTLRGGDEVIWSSIGDIAAGASSKTVASAPPTRVLIDPQSGDVKTDLAGLATGGGIGVLATVAGVAPGNVDLIAPKGTIDAGDAGIRVTGNINIAANNVANAGNIAAGGTSSGTPSAPATGGTTAPAPPPTSPPKENGPAETGATKPQPPPPPAADPLSMISVELLGFGGSGGSDEDKEKEKERKRKEQEESQANDGAPGDSKAQ